MDILTVALQSALRHRDHLHAMLAVQLQNPILTRAASRTEEQLFMINRVIDDLAVLMSAKFPTTRVQLNHGRYIQDSDREAVPAPLQ